MWAEGEEEVAADDSASWRFDGLGFSAPWARSRVAPELPPFEDFTPSVAITVTGRQDGSVVLRRDVRSCRPDACLRMLREPSIPGPLP